jgi:hypothetical protein
MGDGQVGPQEPYRIALVKTMHGSALQCNASLAFTRLRIRWVCCGQQVTTFCVVEVSFVQLRPTTLVYSVKICVCRGLLLLPHKIENG